MKRLKKFMSILLTAIMVLAMCVPVMAGPVTNSKVDITNHNFTAYQIFEGTLSGEATLSDIKWGDGVYGAELLEALKADSSKLYVNCKTAEDVADVLKDYDESSSVVKNFIQVVAAKLTDNGVSGVGSVNITEAGYYLIKDTTNISDTADDAKNLSLLEVTAPGSVTPRVKTDKPTLVKKVKDTNDSTGTSTGWQDSADYDIGDTIPYQLTATMGDLSNYDTYYIKFEDTMTHLTFTEITSVKVGTRVLKNTEYTHNWNPETKQLTVEITDVKTLGASKGTEVVVEYNATLDSDAVIGSTGNPNEADLVYSNNPNGSGTGKTPTDKNIVFTYKLTANKVDQNGAALNGATFELLKKIKGDNGEQDSWVSKGVINGTASSEFSWTGLDDGDYKLVEVTAPTGYNKMNDLEFTINATHDETNDNPALTELTGGDKFTGNVGTGTLSGEIINKAGSELPETGGIGTTIFYVVGVILMLGAGVLLVTKKRMSSNR